MGFFATIHYYVQLINFSYSGCDIVSDFYIILIIHWLALYQPAKEKRTNIVRFSAIPSYSIF